VKSLAESLRGEFVVVNLGAASDRDYDLPAHLRAATTLIEVDAAKSSETATSYFAKHALTSAVAGNTETRTFRLNKFSACSSLLEPRADLIELYGLEKYYEIASSSAVQCNRLPDLLAERNISSIDFLKTDLEGLDFEVIKSCESLLPGVLALQCELRFQPFYVGEPFFHEVVAYLADRHFSLIALTPEYWKPKTPNRKQHKDGRLIWADCLFMRHPDTVTTPLAQAKQVILASMSGRRSYAEYLLGVYKTRRLPKEWLPELNPLVVPRSIRPNIRNTWAWAVLRRMRNALVTQEFTSEHLAER